MRLIPLTQGYSAMVDDGDFEWLNQYKWQAKIDRNTVYAVRTVRREDGRRAGQSMHRVIMGVTDPKIQVDHEFHNGIDNQRKNLRIATNAQNRRNLKAYKNNTSGHKGVHWNDASGHFLANYTINGRVIYLGCFDSKDEAARHYNRAAKEHGEGFELLNDVDPLFPTVERITQKQLSDKRVSDTKERIAKYWADLANGVYSNRCLGVKFQKRDGKWLVVLKHKYIGTFNSRSEAIAARDVAMKK